MLPSFPRRIFSTISSVSKPYFVTTPIYYVNAAPHVGHLFTSLLADVSARSAALSEQSSIVLGSTTANELAPKPTHMGGARLATGTDEHGQKVAAAATRAGVSAPVWAAATSARFSALSRAFNVHVAVETRTSSNAGHAAVVAWLWRRLQARGALYRAEHAGWYASADEAFVPEASTCTRGEYLAKKFPLQQQSDAKEVGSGVDENDAIAIAAATAARTAGTALPGSLSVRVAADSGATVEWVAEETWNFRLAEYAPALRKLLENEEFFTPRGERSALLLEYVNSRDFRDLSVSRLANRVNWALPVPGDSNHTVYVWLDALANYLTASRGGGVEGDDGKPLADDADPRILFPHWPADIHFVGKDIAKFHAIYWPAFLMAAGLELPRRVISHGHFTVGRLKMSKSTGNVVDPMTLIDVKIAAAARAAMGVPEEVTVAGGLESSLSPVVGAPKVVEDGSLNKERKQQQQQMKGVVKKDISAAVTVVIPPSPILGPYPADAIRYALLREGRLNDDGEFNAALLEQRANRDCADTLGNLASRLLTSRFFPSSGRGTVGPYPLSLPWPELKAAGITTGFAEESHRATLAALIDHHNKSESKPLLPPMQHQQQQELPFRKDQIALLVAVDHLFATATAGIALGSPSTSLSAIFAVLHTANKAFTDAAPWKLVPDKNEILSWQIENARHHDQVPPLSDRTLALAALAYAMLETLRVSAILLSPSMPATAPALLAHLGFNPGPAAALLHTKCGSENKNNNNSSTTSPQLWPLGHPLAQFHSARVGAARPFDFIIKTDMPSLILFAKAPKIGIKG